MDGSTISILGGLVGSLVCIIGGIVGARAAWAAAQTDAQRQFLRQLYRYGGLYAAAVMGLILLASFGVLPRGAYLAGFILWFGPLLPAMRWLKPRIDQLTAPLDRTTASA